MKAKRGDTVRVESMGSQFNGKVGVVRQVTRHKEPRYMVELNIPTWNDPKAWVEFFRDEVVREDA